MYDPDQVRDELGRWATGGDAAAAVKKWQGNPQAVPASGGGDDKSTAYDTKAGDRGTPYQRDSRGGLTPMARDMGGNPIAVPAHKSRAWENGASSAMQVGAGPHSAGVHALPKPDGTPGTRPVGEPAAPRLRGPEVPAGRPPSDINQAAAALRSGNPKAAPPQYAAMVTDRINKAGPMGRKPTTEGNTGYYDEKEQYHATGRAVMSDKDFGGKPGAMSEFAKALQGLGAKQSPEERRKNSGLSDADIRGIKYG